MALRYHDHTGWNTSKIISLLLVGLGCSLFADPNIVDQLQKEHPKLLAGMGVGYGKKWSSVYESSNISEMGQDRSKVTIAYHYEVPYALLIGATINDR